MAKKKKAEPKVILEREYIVPLRKEWLKVPKYKRANKAVKALKQFIARHMKVYDRDLEKIKIDIILNNELRFRGMKKPPAKIKVKAKKYDNDIVRVELVEVPAHIKFAKLREEKKKEEIKKKAKAKKVEEDENEEESGVKEGAEPPAKEEKKQETEEAKEKEAASKDETLKLAKEQAKEMKHVAKDKGVRIQRKALAK